MKRDWIEPDLRKVFAPMPEECRNALMDAARSIKEEKTMKRTSFHTMLIAAIILVVSMATAFATQQLGWVDFFQVYDGISVPKAAEVLLNATKPQVYQVGPMTFTFTQLLADGRIALSSAEVHTTDGTEVLYASDGEIFDAVDALSNTVLNHYKLTSGTSWVDAAQQLNLPLYSICATIEVDEAHSGGEAMQDAMWNEEGSIVFFNMPSTNPETVKDSLPVALYMAVREFDPATGEEINRWISSEEAEIPVSGMIAEKTYHPQTNAVLNGMMLTSVHAKQYVTGVYLFANFAAPDGMDEDAARNAVYNLSFCDSESNEFPGGINLSSYANMTDWPIVVLESMISVEELPPNLMITDGTVKVPAQ